MHMVTVTYAIQPEKKEEMRALLHDQAAAQEFIALLMQIPGVIGYYSLLKPDADEGIALYLYATEAEAQAAPTTPQYQPFITSAYSQKLLNCTVPGSMKRQIYEVTGQG